MAIFERGETYTQFEEIRDRDGTLTDPSSVSMYIESPCGTVLVDNLAMSSTTTGVYSYDYALTTTAIYGEYTTIVTAIDGGGNIAKWTNTFFIMPWNVLNEVRAYSGQTVKKISDDDLSLMVWNAYREVSWRVMDYHYREKLCCSIAGICECCGNIECDCTCGTYSPIHTDGYKLSNNPIADFNMDGLVHGCECDDAAEECHNDICGIWINEDGECSNISVEVVNAVCGHIKVYQYDCVTAIPSTNEGIFVNYHSTWHTYNNQMFKKVVVLLATYELALQTNLSSKKVSGCDERGRVSFTDRIWNRYQTIIDSITKPMFGVGR